MTVQRLDSLSQQNKHFTQVQWGYSSSHCSLQLQGCQTLKNRQLVVDSHSVCWLFVSSYTYSAWFDELAAISLFQHSHRCRGRRARRMQYFHVNSVRSLT